MYGSKSVLEGGFNGGGSASGSCVGSGGGATDIRINSISLNARVIVSGGGGGVEHVFAGSYGGAGGGLEGGHGNEPNFYSYSGGGGTQNAPGSQENTYTKPGFGFGGSTITDSTGAGGGGWYGGGSGKTDGGVGGGGSGFVFTNNTKTYYPNCLLSDSYFLYDAETIAGTEEFLGPDGTKEKGHSGNGAIRIKRLKLFPINQTYKKQIGISIRMGKMVSLLR